MLAYVYHALEGFRRAFASAAQLVAVLRSGVEFFSGAGDDRGHLNVPVLARE
jgi:hypothetical protein